ncbi:unnamed protein product [Meganyctiphanes norvegica]|uniref:FAD dependent oxidoreductase domain-containing protein n=1 Tax=Meganyctiphanes norvegica TaxID=48144 RepID=A0AAV2QV63_MEGNR
MVNVTVIGGGVNGVGTALALLQKVPHCKLTLISDQLSPYTTGDGAAGFWGPHLSEGTPEEKILSWSSAGWELFKSWHNNKPEMGVSKVPGVTLSRDEELTLEPWRHIPDDYTVLNQDQLRTYGPDYRYGYSYTSYVAEPSTFLPIMMQEIETLGGQIKQQRITCFEDLAQDSDLIINCSGIGARDLVPDPNVYPIRGQVMRVRAPWIRHYICDDSLENFCYILPNFSSNTVVLGGTAYEDDWNLEVDPKDKSKIWNNCLNAMPELKNCEFVRDWVGLRPGRRNGIRIEEDLITLGTRKVPVVHNYGHGGSGVTMFWGCSQEAAGLAQDIIHKNWGPQSKL